MADQWAEVNQIKHNNEEKKRFKLKLLIVKIYNGKNINSYDKPNLSYDDFKILDDFKLNMHQLCTSATEIIQIIWKMFIEICYQP